MNSSPDIHSETYEVRLQGFLDSNWSDWLGVSRIIYTPNGNTILTCQLPDQTALHGLLAKIRDLNLELISVTRLYSESTMDEQNCDDDSED
jgi:hypothetical protein